ncbi:unnamed protein product [Parascedosporium putredinis]|uniref:Uncharacterized protein n=1 Tax=Parascedosporium putredinis TaxID=1442378 RepID=A0A9P1H3Y8_9PEZI|nr:unnamed protein product [Parascedosporium putredinis]CAI7996229.1 unnamed protein product [Parascedosporium putredinis]
MAQRYQQQVTVGWIAPMALELTPALAVLENYEQVATDDEMTYYVGKIGAHFVVVTVCPRIGTTQAASTVTHMPQLGGQQKRDFSDPGGKNDYLFPDRYLHQVEDKLCKLLILFQTDPEPRDMATRHALTRTQPH